MLVHLGYRDASRWKRRMVFHIDVVTTEGALNEAEFYLSSEQLKKVRPFLWLLIGSKAVEDRFDCIKGQDGTHGRIVLTID